MKNSFVSLSIAASMFLGSLNAFASDAIVQVLAPLTEAPIEFAIYRTKVEGKTAVEQFRYYAETVMGWEKGDYKINMRMEPKDFPEADGGENVLGLAKIIDVSSYISAPTGDDSDSDFAKRDALVRKVLFQARDLGGLVGLESFSWHTCGVAFPGVIILDVKGKELIALSPANTDC